MFRLIALIFSLPWPVLVLLAGGLFWMGHDAKQKAVAVEAEKVQALADGQPVAVPLDEYDAEVRHPAGEVHVTAWVNPAYNYELTKQKRGTDTVRRMFVLFGPGDALDSRVARGIVLIRPQQVDAFLELMIAQVTGEFDGRLLFNLNGARGDTAGIGDMVEDALDEQGLMKAADFVVVEPYFKGREAALAPDPDAGATSLQVFGVLGGVLLLVAVRNALVRRKLPERKRSLAEVEIPPVGAPISHYAVPQAKGAVAPPPPPVDGTWSPLEAVRARQAARDGVAPAPVGFGAGGDHPVREDRAERPSGRTRGMRAPVALVGALGLYFVIYLVFGGLTPTSTLNGIPEGGIADKLMGGILGFDMSEVEANFGTGPTPVMDEALPPTPVTPVPTEAAPSAPMPQGIAGMAQPLPQVGDTPAPKDQVQEDIAAGVPPAEAVRRAIVAEFPEEETGPVFLTPGGEAPVAEAGLGQRLRDLIPQGLGRIIPLPEAGSAQASESAGPDLPLPLPLLVAVVAAGAAGLLLMIMAMRLLLSRRGTGLVGGGQARRDPWDRLSDRLR
ncbi:hypothetical protein [Paragemmobacter ruber]|uniref:Uncharacterized protein n=1 Tax=Paragemmobacter ruber TaxID=1985673 RepID=A0ABW9YC91_9RHOB|nr:hypothetical protein [Rhodobacter ruber]NBE09652.1 hypothetical protein [Rhodobacter ruber]